MLPRGLLKEYSHVFAILYFFIDMLIVLFAGWVAYLIRFDDYRLSPAYLAALGMAVLVSPLIFSFFNIYRFIRRESFLQYIANLFQAICVVVFVLTAFSFFTQSGNIYSRTWFLIWMGILFLLLTLSRLALLSFLRLMRVHGLKERRIAIFGAGTLGVNFSATVQQALWTGFRIITFIDDNALNLPSAINNIPVKQTPKAWEEFLLDEQIDEIWFALPLRAEARVKEILHELRHHTTTIRFVLDIFGLDLLNYSVTDVAGFPVLNLRSTPMTGVNRLLKALEDRIIALFILLGISPLLFIIALAVKLTSSGPIFFRQKRHGWDGRIITVYKFRTMMLHEEHAGVVTQATLDDKRVTRVGKFLRRTSLDELPQFINVLQGRMSIVGPRPHAVAHNEYYKDVIRIYMQRHCMKPGITGWAQINGWRGETDTLQKMEKRIEYDLYYINNWSVGFDLKIIFLTIIRGFRNRNAY